MRAKWLQRASLELLSIAALSSSSFFHEIASSFSCCLLIVLSKHSCAAPGSRNWMWRSRVPRTIMPQPGSWPNERVDAFIGQLKHTRQSKSPGRRWSPKNISDHGHRSLLLGLAFLPALSLSLSAPLSVYTYLYVYTSIYIIYIYIIHAHTSKF